MSVSQGFLNQLIGQQDQTLTEIAILLGQDRNSARETTSQQILTAIDGIISLLNDPTIGLDALHSQIAALAANQVTDTSSIITAIGTPQQVGDPVTLPTTTPSGGAWLDAGNAGNTIWEFTEVPGDITPYEANYRAGAWVDFLEVDGVGPQIDWLFYASAYHPVFDYAWTVSYPSDDPSTILSTDDMLTWLTRVNPGASCSWFGGTGAQVAVHFSTGSDIEDFLTLIIDAQFQVLKAQLFPSSSSENAPVWPGLSGVTLLTPVAIADGVTITEVMHGCLIAVASYPLSRGQFSFNGVISVRNLGALAFFSDNGDEEFPQTLGFTSAVYLPKSMASAAGLVFRTTGGVTGTITPFTIP